jgi:ribonuclease-3
MSCRGEQDIHSPKIGKFVILSNMKDLQAFFNQSGELEQKLSYSFSDKQLLALAFTHCSFVNESRAPLQHNERVEFLGDAILGAMVSAYLYRKLPDMPEGELSAIRAKLVEATSCSAYIQKLGVERFLLLGRGERMNDGRGREGILSDLFEALLGAIFLDSGMAAVQDFFFGHFQSDIDAVLLAPLRNPKALLQDYCQKQFQVTPYYRVLSETGPDHSKIFKMMVMIQERELGCGEGPSKKEAQQAAARSAMSKLQSHMQVSLT